MARVLKASCNSSGKVSFGGIEVDVAEVLSEGKQDSEGVLLMDKELVLYLASSATDIKETLTKINDVIEQVKTAMTTLEGLAYGGTGSAPIPNFLSGPKAGLDSIKTEIDTLKDGLK